MVTAQSVVEIMIQRGVEPNTVTYTTLMDGYCLRGQIDEALKVIDVMLHKGCSPHVMNYNILINGYCKIKKIDEAMSLFQEMLAKDLFLILLACGGWGDFGLHKSFLMRC
ncbi:hypothetical protein L1049_020168 [Liquidambar formosana]|uniref:Pentatricopeptide repeat-containing protein n=1 Tax=Liquidambar formosana TaxID=63359 RepID=A0AAP0S7J8_LIQFO